MTSLELLPCLWCKNLPGVKVGPPAMARCVTLGCYAKTFAAVPVDHWNRVCAEHNKEIAKGEDTKSAPVQRTPHNTGERLPSSDAAGAGADTPLPDREAVAWPDTRDAIIEELRRARDFWMNKCSELASAPPESGDVRKATIEECVSAIEAEMVGWPNSYRAALRRAIEHIRALSPSGEK